MKRRKPPKMERHTETPGLPRRDRSGRARWMAGPGLLLAAMTAAAYLPVTRCGYIWDDNDYVQNNPTLRSVEGLRRIWFDTRATPQYYPLVHTTYWLEYRLWKTHPSGYHIVNILLHAAGAVLLWRVLTRLQLPGAWAAAALFALHPVQVESVAWITERKNVLSGVFYFGAALAYLRYALPPNRGSGPERLGRFYALSLVLFLGALFSKTVTCTLPAVLLLVLWWKRGRVGRADLRALTPLFVLAVGLALVTIRLEKQHVGAEGEEWNLSLVERGLLAGRALCFYAGKLFWPAPLAFLYPRWHLDSRAWPQYLYPLAVIGVMAALWGGRRRLGRGPLVAVLSFAGTLFPALGFFAVYPMRYSFVADHFQYLACAGLITLVVATGYGMADRLGRWGKACSAIILGVVLATLGTLTWRQGHVYENEETLWRETLRKNPEAWLAHLNLGILVQDQGRLEEAVAHYLEVLRLNPTSFEAHNNLGSILEVKGRAGEAIEHYRKALRLRPDSARTHCNLGMLLVQTGSFEEAVEQLRRTVELKPSWPPGLDRLAWVLATQPKATVRDREEAVGLARRAAELTGYQNAEVLDTLGAAYAAAGRFDQAVKTAQAALDLASAAQGDPLATLIRRRLELYRQGQPYREPGSVPGTIHP